MKKIKYYCDNKKCKYHTEELDGEWISISISRIGKASKKSTSSVLFAGLHENDDQMDFCSFDCLKEFINGCL